MGFRLREKRLINFRMTLHLCVNEGLEDDNGILMMTKMCYKLGEELAVKRDANFHSWFGLRTRGHIRHARDGNLLLIQIDF